MTSPDAARVLAVVPSFNPSSSLTRCIESLIANDIAHIVIVDDGSTNPASQELLEALETQPSSNEKRTVTIIRKPMNSGIASSLNLGITAGRSDAPNAVAVLTIDQDSQLPDGYVVAALAQLDLLRQHGKHVGLLAPQCIAGRPSKRDPHYTSAKYDALFDPIQSAALIPVETFDAIGQFNEALIIDGVDTEFNYRCLEAGLGLYAVPGTDLAHSIGEPVPLRLFGRPVSVFGWVPHVGEHAPARLYYIVRNSMLIARSHRRLLGWRRVLRRQIIDLPSILIAVTLSESRKANRRAVRDGLRDARQGLYGRRP